MSLREIIAVDPGTRASGVVVYRARRILAARAAWPNEDLHAWLAAQPLFTDTDDPRVLAIEKVECYGPDITVGQTTFDTVYWSGRFASAWQGDVARVPRRAVKLFLCGSSRAGNTQVRQALLDTWPATGGGRTPQVGTKARPGPLYGVSSHAWSALAVAVTLAHAPKSFPEFEQ